MKMRLVFLRPVTVALVFACLILPFLLTAIMLVPPGEVPDEEAHIVRADSLRHGEIMGRRGGTITMPDGQQGPSAGVIADRALLWAGKALPPGMGEKVDQAMLDRVKGVAWGEATYVPVSNTAVYGPAFYVPAAIAITLVKAGGGTPYDAILAARGLNAILYIAIGAAALCLARRGHLILLFVLGLPMSLSLAASVNQDGLMIAASAMVAALLTRVMADGDRRCAWAAAGLLCILLMAKPVYLPIALLLLLPLPRFRQAAVTGGRWFGVNRSSVVAFLLVSLVALGWALVNAAFVSVPFIKAPYETGPLAMVAETLSTTSPGRQLHVLLDSPLRFITLPLATIGHEAELWWLQFVGVLGTNDLLFDKGFYGFWGLVGGFALAVTLLGSFRAGSSWPALADAILLAVTILVSIWLMLIGQYLSWTLVGAPLIEGMQGRYLLPMAPFLILALPVGPTEERPFFGPAALILLAATVFGAASSLDRLLTAYYIGGA